MADFTTVMHEMQRMCEAFIKKDECQNCPLINNPVCGSPVDIDGKDIAKAEADTMAWAAEHPEPQYPTWSEWLVEIGVFPEMMSTIPSKALDAIINGVCKPIPADIAEKQGIKPKEGV